MKENPSDEILMQRIAEGCDASFAQLYDRYGARMHRYFYRMLGQDAAVADDFTQELFMKIIEKKALYDPDRRFSTWFYTVAGNLVKNEYRRRSRRQGPPPGQEGFSENFAANLDQELFEKQLAVALDQLDEVQRECFVLRYQEDLSLREIADIQDCPEGTVKSRLFYTIKKLSGKLRTFAGAGLLT